MVNDETELPEHVRRNRVLGRARRNTRGPGNAHGRARNRPGASGGCRTQAHVLPEDLAGKDVIELGCGTAYISAWLARRGARVVGIDNSAAQLATAAGCSVSTAWLTLIHGNAEQVPYPDAELRPRDLRVRRVLVGRPVSLGPEAARLLRPGGALVFLVNSALLTLCAGGRRPRSERRLLRSAFEVSHRVARRYECRVPPVHGDWLRLLRRSGFEIEISSKSRRRKRERRAIHMSLRSGRGSGHRRRSGRPGAGLMHKERGRTE